jgi:DNA repair exonuclease SbcCD ATPase subunit
LAPFFNIFKKKSEKENGNRKYQNKIDLIKPIETKDRTTISIVEAKDIVKKIDQSQTKILTERIDKIRHLTQKPIENIQSIISNLESTKIDVHESSFESVVVNSKKMVINSIRKELSSNIPPPVTLNDVIKLHERLDSMVNRFSEVSKSHKKVFNFFISKYADKLKTEFENISSLSMQCKYEIDNFENERQPLQNCFDNIEALIQKNELIKLEEDKFKTKQFQLDDFQLKIKKLNAEINDLTESKKYVESKDIVKKIQLLDIEKNNLHKELINAFSRVSRAMNKYSYGLNRLIVQRIDLMTEQPWKIFEDFQTYMDLIKEIKNAISKGKIILKESEKIETYFDNIINSLPDYKEKEEKLNNEIKKLNSNKNMHIISKLNELKKKFANYHEELRYIESYLNESQNEIAKHKEEYDNLLSSIETYINLITKSKYHLSMLK